MDFRSDNVASAAPEIVDAVAQAARGSATPYGGDPWTEGLEPAFSELFETEVRVFPVVTGTAANSLAVATLTPPWGVIYAGRAAHVENDECGAPEFMTGGAKVTGIDERFGKIVPAALEAALAAAGTGEVHWSQPACLSLTQSTEMGQIYTADELGVLTGIARNHGLAVHMDGARFANAVAGSGRSPADLTWRAGVDALSFGATKNGALAAEAIVLFDHEGAGDLAFRHKRAGQLLSKMRFISAQLAAYIADGLWLRLAERANRQARRLAAGLEAIPGASLAAPAEANELFVTLPRAVIDGLAEAGVLFYSWPETDPATTTIRLVTRHDTDESEVDALIETAHRLATETA